MRKAYKRWAKPNGAAAETKDSSLQDGEMSEAGSGLSSKTPQKRHARSSMEQQNGKVVEQVPKNHKAEMSVSATTSVFPVRKSRVINIPGTKTHLEEDTWSG